MKVKWEIRKGKFVEIEVTDEQAEVLVELKRQGESHERKYKRRELKETSLDYLYDEFEWEAPDKSIDIPGDFEREETAEQVRRAIACLTEKQQLLIRLRYYEDKSLVEIAAAFGVTKSAITHQFETIHRTLKKILENF